MKSKNINTPESFPFFNRSQATAEKLAAAAWKEWGYENTPALQIASLRGYIDMPFFLNNDNTSAMRAIGNTVVVAHHPHEGDETKGYRVINCASAAAAQQLVEKFNSGEKHTVFIGGKTYRKMFLILSPEAGGDENGVSWSGVKDVEPMEQFFFALIPTDSFESLCAALTPDEDGNSGYRLF